MSAERPWNLDADGKRLWDERDSSDCWNIADLKMDRVAVRDYLNDLEARLASAEANHLPQMSALAGAIANERDENRRLKTALASAKARGDAMQLERDDAQWVANGRRVKIEAAEAQLGRFMRGEIYSDPQMDFIEGIKAKMDATTEYAAKLLELVERQRAVLIYVRNQGSSGMPQIDPVLKAIDYDALVEEARELGIDATTPRPAS